MLKAGKLTASLVAAVSIVGIALLFNSGKAFAADATDTTVTDVPGVTCTDASDASSLAVTWNKDASQISIVIKGGLPICEDVDVFYSAYSMPDNYDGTGFYVGNTTQVNPTAVGQTLQQSYEFTLAKGTLGTWLENVPKPATCYNSQVDLYYGPEVTSIDNNGVGYHADGTPAASDASSPAGHGTQNIASQIFIKDTAACTPGMGGGTPAASTPTPAVGGSGAGTITASAPTVLPDTGLDNSMQLILISVASLILGGGALVAGGVRALRRR